MSDDPVPKASAGLREVARRAQVSPVTASRALNGYPHVKTATREKVLRAARDLNYRPNPLLAAAAAKRFREPASDGGVPIAFLANQQRPIRQQWLGAGEARAEQLGYHLEFHNVHGRADLHPLLRELVARGAEGLILGPWHTNFELLRQIDFYPLSTVEWGRHIQASGFHCVRPSSFAVVLRAAGEAAKRGFQAPGFVLFEHNPRHPDDIVRHAAAVECYRLHDFSRNIVPLVVNDFEDLNSPVFDTWYNEHRPDVIIGFTGNIKNIVWDRPIPGIASLPFINLHTEPTAATSSPGIANINEKVIAAAVDYLHELIKRGERGHPAVPYHRVIEPEWHEGGVYGKPLPWKSPAAPDATF